MRVGHDGDRIVGNKVFYCGFVISGLLWCWCGGGGGAISGEARVVVVVPWVALGWREGEDREIEMEREK